MLSNSISNEYYLLSLIGLNFTSFTIKDIFLAILSSIFGLYLLILLLILKKSPFDSWIIRKIVHFLGGTYIAFFVFYFSSFSVIIISIFSFLVMFIILIIFSKLKLLSEYFILNIRIGEKKYTFLINTIITLMIFFCMYLIVHQNPIFFTSGVLVLSWGDTFGEVIGKIMPICKYKIINQKTISGSIGVFLFTFLSFFTSLLINKNILTLLIFLKFLLGSFVCTLIEAISWKWFDNILLPPIGSIIMYWAVKLN